MSTDRDPHQDEAFVAVADELYSLTPEEFTAARNERVKQAKQAGDKELAGRIKKLSKPNSSAWLANRLVRDHPAEIQPLLELGEDLRAALADRSGDRLRELAKVQRLLIASLVDEAKQGARDAGRTVAAEAVRGLVDTLRAALNDAGAAGELLAGRLTAPLFRSGLEGDNAVADNPADDNPAGGNAAGVGPAATNAADDGADSDPRTEASRRAGEVASAAGELVTEARDADSAARQAVADTSAEVERLQARLAELTAELQSSSARLSEAKSSARGTGTQLQKAERTAAAAQRRLRELSGG